MVSLHSSHSVAIVLPGLAFERYNSMTDRDIPSTNNTQSPLDCEEDRPRVKLGGNPGTLIASIPALMGFTPEESLVIVGLYNASTTGRAMRIGPIVRTDLGMRSIAEGLDQIMAVCDTLYEPEVVVIAVSEEEELACGLLSVLGMFFEDNLVGINGLHWVEKIESGVPWCFPDGEMGGVVEDVDDNPLRTIGRCSGALQLKDREERERWLLPTMPRLDTRELLAETPEDKDADEHTDAILAVTRLLSDVVLGHRSLDEVIEDHEALMAVARLAIDEDDHTFLVLCAQGTVNPVMRDMVAECARRTRGSMRIRLLALLSVILASNDEGSLAHFVAAGAAEECSARSQRNHHDCLTEEMLEVLLATMRCGHQRQTVRAVVACSLHHLASLTLELSGECAADVVDDAEVEELIEWAEQLDEALDVLEWPAITRALST
ncbi:DUF4192 family protein [Corynebacterium sp. zg254]|uniref:DUF4192 family protein n=2 Tax=Corynebacteriaceae TaxID=1653 RepID=A0ABQ6VLR8_9CORY|nr:DUF4192 family protein [Corynebacterium zhongnanshanii]MCR5913475.1 DUF4192 family protein [Corynebacterium sp. zg254]